MESGIEKGRPLPQWVEEAPELAPGDEFYLTAFWDLSTCRDLGWGVGPIPWRDIILYADRAGLEEDTATAFVAIIRHMDTAYLRWQEQEQKRREKTGAKR